MAYRIRSIGGYLKKNVSRATAAFVTVALVSCSTTQRITVDYAKDFDFETVKSFSYLNTKESNAKTRTVDQGIRKAIRARLVKDGLTEVSRGADLVVTYHFTTEDQPSFVTTNRESGNYGDWGPGWGRWGYAGPSASWKRWEYEGPGLPTSRKYDTAYPSGTLILDAIHPVTRTLLWRGTGIVNIDDEPNEQLQQAEKIITTVSERWQGIMTGMSG
ncbi:MAG: DUF4136 domain-containing protein [Verrucomicrobiota bacterium]